MRRILPPCQLIGIVTYAKASSSSPSSVSDNDDRGRQRVQTESPLLNLEQARMAFETTSDRRKSPVANLSQSLDARKSSFVSRTTNDDGTVTGIRSLRQGWPIYAAVLFVVVTYLVVTKTEEANMARRHESIEKDIERERWRARELGLHSKDDGFAENYMTTLGKPNAADSAQNPMDRDKRQQRQ